MAYELNNNIATISFDDGKANVVGHAFLDTVNAELDRAERETAGAVILRGREGMFSGGFDLREFEKGMEPGLAMVKRGFELLIRLYSFPLPVVAACTGHAVAMGAFIVMSCDTRVGARGNYKYRLPETLISMDLSPLLVKLTASRIDLGHMTRVALQSEIYNPDQAVEAGFIDEAVEPGDLDSRTRAVAEKLALLPAAQYAQNKLRIRDATLAAMRTDLIEMFGQG